tara:strand:+ start:231 stop:506 length:276 start_codon:yes stop_codon:yes gene_type:complete
MSKLNNIVNNLFDIIISLVRMVGSYSRDIWDSVVVIWKDNDLPQEEEKGIWNGGETFGSVNSGYTIDDDETTPTPMDDIITYDGMMDEIEE